MRGARSRRSSATPDFWCAAGTRRASEARSAVCSRTTRCGPASALGRGRARDSSHGTAPPKRRSRSTAAYTEVSEMARRIPLPRLTRRQRLARWQRERRQQALYVVIFSGVLFFVVGLVAWAASDKYYQDNLKPALRIDGAAVPVRDWRAGGKDKP